MNPSLKQNIESSHLRARRKEATYERVRARLSSELQALMVEKGLTMEMLAERLNFTVSETRQRVCHNDLRLGQLIDILDILDLEPYTIFRPRRGWVVQ